LAYKERFLTPHGISEKSLIRRHLVGRLVGCDKLKLFTLHDLSRNLGAGTERDLYDRTDTEAVIIRLGRLDFPKNGLGWTLEFHLYLRGRHGQALTCPDVERHISPTPGVDREFDCSERLNLRIGGNSILPAIAAVLAPHNMRRIKWSHGL